MKNKSEYISDSIEFEMFLNKWCTLFNKCPELIAGLLRGQLGEDLREVINATIRLNNEIEEECKVLFKTTGGRQ